MIKALIKKLMYGKDYSIYEDRFQHNDLYAAAYFITKGIKLLDINRSNPRRCLFIMDIHRQDGDKIFEDYRNGDFFEFKHAIDLLKDKLYNEPRHHNRILENREPRAKFNS